MAVVDGRPPAGRGAQPATVPTAWLQPDSVVPVNAQTVQMLLAALRTHADVRTGERALPGLPRYAHKPAAIPQVPLSCDTGTNLGLEWLLGLLAALVAVGLALTLAHFATASSRGDIVLQQADWYCTKRQMWQDAGRQAHSQCIEYVRSTYR